MLATARNHADRSRYCTNGFVFSTLTEERAVRLNSENASYRNALQR